MNEETKHQNIPKEAKKLKLPQGVTEEQVKVWKNKYSKLEIITIKDTDGKEYVGIFRRPDMQILSLVNAKYKSDETAALQALYQNTKLAVDEEIEKDAVLKVAVAGQLGELFRRITATHRTY